MQFYSALFWSGLLWSREMSSVFLNDTKNKLTVTRGDIGGDNGAGSGEGEGLSRNMYKGHMDKAKKG